jgi:hypothetical protein
MSSGEMGEQVVFEEDHLLKEALTKYADMAQPYLMNRSPDKKKLPDKESQLGTDANKGKYEF